MQTSVKEQPLRLGVTGIGLIISIISLVYHVMGKSNTPEGVFSAPTQNNAMWLVIGLAVVFIPGLSSYVTELISFIGKAIGIIKQIESAIPAKLVADIVTMISGGHVDLAKLFADFQEVDPKVIMDLIHQLAALFGGTLQVAPSTNPLVRESLMRSMATAPATGSGEKIITIS